MTKKVIVVGSGFGGLASALRLKSKGIMMLHFLKNMMILVVEQEFLKEEILFLMLDLQL